MIIGVGVMGFWEFSKDYLVVSCDFEKVFVGGVEGCLRGGLDE